MRKLLERYDDATLDYAMRVRANRPASIALVRESERVSELKSAPMGLARARKLLGDNGGQVSSTSSQESFLRPFSLQDVRLVKGSQFERAQQTNLEYLLFLDIDRLVWR